MISYRTFRDEDFEEVLVLLNQGMDYDNLERFLLSEKLYEDPAWNPDRSYLALENSQIVGFLQGVTRSLKGKEIGYIKLFAVKEKFRRRGIGSALLRQFENDLRAGNFEFLRLFDVPLNYFMPGLDPRYTPAVCFFERLGFQKKDEAVNMEADLFFSDWKTEEKQKELLKDNISVERIDSGMENELFNFIKEEWELWDYELRMAMKGDPPSIFIARKSGEIKAFSAWDGNNRGTGWFGPMGTHPDLRGRGVGGVLLYKCLEDMRNRGYKQCTIPWVGPVSFYSHYAGAKITRLFWRYEKNIK